MSGEIRMVKTALLWGGIAAMPAAAIAYFARGAHGAFSVLLALAIVLANAGLAALFSALAGRRSALGAAAIAMPSFGLRMVGILLALAALKHQPFIDEISFILTFGIAVTAVLFLEARAWKRTPWLALTLDKKEQP